MKNSFAGMYQFTVFLHEQGITEVCEKWNYVKCKFCIYQNILSCWLDVFETGCTNLLMATKYCISKLAYSTNETFFT